MSTAVRGVEVAIEVGVIGLLVLAPIPVASDLPWVEPAIVVWAACLLALWAARMLVAGELVIPRTPALWPGVALVAVVAVQLAVPGWSASPYATSRGLALLGACLAVLVVLSSHLLSRARLLRLIGGVVGGGVAVAVAMLAGRAWGGSSVAAPVRERLAALDATSPDHQALHLALVLFLLVGVMLCPRRGNASPHASAAPAPAVTRARLARLAGRVLLVGAAGVLGAAILLSGSRAGLLAVGTGCLAVAVLSLHRREEGGSRAVARSGMAGLLAVLLLASVAWLGLDGPRARRATSGPAGTVAEAGPGTWAAAIRMAGESPVIGLGLGAFADASLRYRTLPTAPSAAAGSAPSDVSRLLAETGLSGLVILAWVTGGVGAFVLRRWLGRRDPFVRGLATGGLGALAALLAHGTAAAGLDRAGNALTAAAVVAVLVAVVTSRLHRAGYRVELPAWRWPLAWRGRLALAVLLLTAVGASMAVVLPAMAAERHLRRVAQLAGDPRRPLGDSTASDHRGVLEELLVAASLDPRNPAIQADLARVAQELGERAWRLGLLPDGRQVESRNVAARLAASQDLLLRAHEAYVEAIRWRPRAGALHERLAWSLGLLDDVRRAVQGTLMPVAVAPALDGLVASAESLLPRAVDHLRQAVHWDPGNALLHLSLGRFVLGHLPPDPASQQLAGEAFHQALALDPRLLPRVAESLAQHGAAGADLYRVSVPRQPPLVVALGHELERRERPRLALAMFQHALESAATPAEQAEANLALAAAFLRRREPAAAVAHARRALVLQPADPAVFAMLGSAYEASQRWDEAEAALASALGLVERADAERGREYRGRLAGLLVRRGQAERAVQLWLLAIQQAPGDAWAQLELARLFEGRADWSGAAARYRAAQDLAPQDPGVQGEAGRAYLRHGQLREARAALEIATRSRPADASLHLDLAELYRRMGAAERAAEQYREVLSLQPDHDGARLALTGVSPAGPAGPRR